MTFHVMPARVFTQGRRRKYGNEPRMVDGIRYDSHLEARIASELDLRMKAGELKDIERQVTVDLYAHGEHICKYRVDFKITHADGMVEWIEVKGFETPEWRLKWKLFEAQMAVRHPDNKLTIIRQ